MAQCSVCGKLGKRGKQIGVVGGRYMCGVNFGCYEPPHGDIFARVVNYLKAQA